MMKIKICGITEPVGLTAAIEAGADFIGFVFHPASPRFLDIEVAAQLARYVPERVKIVGLFVNPDDALLGQVLDNVRLDMIQLHGDESLERVQEVKARFNVPVMKALPVATEQDLEQIASYELVADWLLLDSKHTPLSLSPPGRGQGEGPVRSIPGSHKVPALLRERARELRANQTDTEGLLWWYLRDRRFNGYKFKRQHPVKPYILDFVCLEQKLVVEVDGSQHGEQIEYDTARTVFLNALGFEVLRFSNVDILHNMEPVLEIISICLENPERVREFSPSSGLRPPSPQGEKGLFGGSGKAFDWNLLKNYKFNKPWMLAGGLTPENVRDALSVLTPDAVDVSSGVEKSKGVKDPAKITAFIANARKQG